MHPTIPESTENWVTAPVPQGGGLCTSLWKACLPFPVSVVPTKRWLGLFLHLRLVQRFLFFLTFMLALSFNYLDVVILGKPVLSITVCLPSKASPLPPYLCELIKISSSNCSLPLFGTSSPSQLTSLSLFPTLLSTLTPTLSPLWNNKLFPLSFPLTEDVFGPIPKKSLARNHIRAVPCFHWARFQGCLGGLKPAVLRPVGLALSITFVTVQHSQQATLVVTGLVSLASPGTRLLFSYSSSKSLLVVRKSGLLLYREWKGD